MQYYEEQKALQFAYNDILQTCPKIVHLVDVCKTPSKIVKNKTNLITNVTKNACNGFHSAIS